jgi:hypothetical protein
MDGIRKGNKKTHAPKCYATGGRVPEDISEGALPMMDDPGSFDYGMEAEGGLAATRMDRPAKKSAPVNVNIIVNSGKSQQPDMPPPLPPMAGPPGPMPPPPGPPMGAPMGGPPPGIPMRKDGGRVNDPMGIGAKVRGVASEAKRIMNQTPGETDAGEKRGSWKNFGKDILRMAPNDKKPERASGGRVMEGGAGGGLGRLALSADAAKSKK